MQARGGEAEQRDALLRLLSEAAPEAEVLASVRNACLLIQPSCGMDTYQAAISGEQSTRIKRSDIQYDTLPTPMVRIAPSWIPVLCQKPAKVVPHS